MAVGMAVAGWVGAREELRVPYTNHRRGLGFPSSSAETKKRSKHAVYVRGGGGGFCKEFFGETGANAEML